MTDNDLTKRLMWAGLIAALGALASALASRGAALIWRQVFDEEPPE
jgi:hypothetical protein